ncbi:MAG: class I SAM-dependent methyltransferase [Nitrospinota bacterium]
MNLCLEETLGRLQPERLKHKVRQGQERWEWISHRLGPEGRKGIERLIEIGSGEGTFLEVARNYVQKAVGIDFNPLFITYCQEKGLEVIKGEWPLTLPEGRFDFAAMFHVAEHLSDPIACLRQVKNVLGEGGYLCMETPDVWRPVGNLQKTFLGPDHVFLLSEGTLEPFLAKAGFEVIAIEPVELGIRALARPREGLPVEWKPQPAARLRRRFRLHQIRWHLIAEWREWLARRWSGGKARAKLD